MIKFREYIHKKYIYYEKGVFGKVDLENAKKYYTLGANKGNKFCIEALKRITKKENK